MKKKSNNKYQYWVKHTDLFNPQNYYIIVKGCNRLTVGYRSLLITASDINLSLFRIS